MTDVLVYVQHLLGIGHLKRMAVINQAMRDLGLSVCVVSGGIPDNAIDFCADQVIQLPPCKTADTGFSGLIDAQGQPVNEEWKQSRREMLLQIFKDIAPRLLLVEMFPFGRRAFRFELVPLLELAQQKGVFCVSSVRDLLVRKNDPAKEGWMRDTARKYFDKVLVHGDPGLFEFGKSFPYANDIADLIDYTGYVAPPYEIGSETKREGVLVSAGGGAVGKNLLENAIAAKPLSRRFANAPWKIVTGPHLPQKDFDRLTQISVSTDIELFRFLSDFRTCMAKSCVSVSQAGYNTLMDALVTHTPAVMVPFAENNESEQGERAAIMAQSGMISLLPTDQLTPQRLANEIDNAKIPGIMDIALDGGQITAMKIAVMLRGDE